MTHLLLDSDQAKSLVWDCLNTDCLNPDVVGIRPVYSGDQMVDCQGVFTLSDGDIAITEAVKALECAYGTVSIW
jgi:hypothetical protein